MLGHNKLWLVCGGVFEELAVGLDKHAALLVQLEVVQDAGVAPILEY